MKHLAGSVWVKSFGISALVTIGVIVAVLFGMGPAALLATLLLMIIEIVFSFDNAIVNAKVLAKLSPFWQKMFLTVGILIAIFGMRVIFPILIVAVTSQLPWSEVLDLALHHPGEYAEKLEQTHTAVMAFGGSFLMMLALHFLMDDRRKEVWIKRLEAPLQRWSTWWLPAVTTLALLSIVAALPGNHHADQTLEAGIAGVLVYAVMQLFVHGVERLSGQEVHKARTGWAAFATFMYLEVLDASFSFDGVIGAFAITNQVVLIAAGLGIGAIWVRSFTIFMLRHGTLNAYKYLDHGAHYAITALAFAMFASTIWNIPEVVTGLVSLGVIVSSIIASRQARHAQKP